MTAASELKERVKPLETEKSGDSTPSTQADSDEDNKILNEINAIKEKRNGNLDAHDMAFWREKPNTEDFSWSPEGEPHVRRRREILKKYPQIKDLYKPDPLSALFCVFTVSVQYFLMWYLSSIDASYTTIALLAYCPGGYMAHSLMLAMHELSHDLWFKSKWANYLCGLFSNTPMTVAVSASFRRYHLEHHSFQGSDKWDADIPTKGEGYLFKFWFTKLFFVTFQWVFYAFRPMLTKPKDLSRGEVINWAVILAFDLCVIKYLGVKAFAYLALSVVLGLGPHPMTGHFIAEHFEFVEGQETYSYYGPLNYLTYNVGYHNEHHDFPKVPGRMLPKITEMAPEYYLNMPHYKSWTKVILGFVFGKNMSCFCRIKRTP